MPTARAATAHRTHPARRFGAPTPAGGSIRPFVVRHAALIVLLAAGAALRVLAMIAYRPALFFSDSWGYLFTAFTGHPVSLSYLRPNGYAVLIRLLTLPDRNLEQLIAIQDLSGLALAVLVYAALLRMRAGRPLAILGAALIVLDGYRITLEQYVMPDTLFTLSMLLSMLLLAWPGTQRAPGAVVGRPGPWAAAFSGLLLAASVVQREAALFVVPAFLVYLVWIRVGLRAGAAFVLALALPVLAYAALYQARVGVFGLTESDGWTLYGRVAGFAECRGAGIPRPERPLCETARQRASHPDAATWYIWDGGSPAARLFHGGHQNRQVQERANRRLRDFADRIILHQPIQYLDATFSDVLRYFTPGATPFNDAISATSLPRAAVDEATSERVRKRVLPRMHPSVRPPAGFLHSYRQVVHVPRPVLALLAIAALLALPLRTIARREVLLFAGSGLLLILGTSATAGFGLRYLLPAVPLLAIGGGAAVRDLLVARAGEH
ncbi:MAG TPA: phospholipid carrier-dependent glycosyltransferase [Solirubrobacteraceae bacterium]|nr:phospholipid carrier-dependent glycosyltransferase [Solirubrobacteraceae bacterium]